MTAKEIKQEIEKKGGLKNCSNSNMRRNRPTGCPMRTFRPDLSELTNAEYYVAFRYGFFKGRL